MADSLVAESRNAQMRNPHVLTLDEVGRVRRFVRAHFSAKQCPKSFARLRERLLASMAKSSTRSTVAVASMLEVAHLAALAAASSVVSTGQACSRRKSLGDVVFRLGSLGLAPARARLARQMQKWRTVSDHDNAFARHFRKMCWQEALKTIHRQLASGALSLEAKRHHGFRARLADVRAEICADLCSLPEMRGALAADEAIGSNAPQPSAQVPRWRGVNLGGWLLWEPGPADETPLVASLESCDVPKDEWTLCEELIAKFGRTQAEALFHWHRANHVTREDFLEIKRLGANAVRVPFGYWAIVGPREGEPFMGPCTEFLDAALQWGIDFSLSIVLCLHAAVGFQSPDPPCGRGNEQWDPNDFDHEATIEVLRQVAKRYGNHPALGGICILNEPHGDLPPKVLSRYFQDAYTVLRESEKLPLSVQIMLPIFHHEFDDFAHKFTAEKGYSNVVFDVHCYQVFGDPYAGWGKMSLADHLRFASGTSRSHPARAIADHGERVVVTEFSLGLPFPDESYTLRREIAALKPKEEALLRRSFASRQMRAFDKLTEGWFFWSWRDDAGPAWDFCKAIQTGWMPALCDIQQGEEEESSALAAISVQSVAFEKIQDNAEASKSQVDGEDLPAKRQRTVDGFELANLCIA